MYKNVSFFFICFFLISCTRVDDFLHKGKSFFNLFQHEVKPIQNILVVSFCSVSSDFLPLFGEGVDEKEFPNFSRVLNSSFNFTNAYTNKTWSNTRRFIFKDQWQAIYGSNAAQAPIQEWSFDEDGQALFARFPAKNDLTAEYNDYYNDDRLDIALKDFNKITEEIKKRNKGANKKMWMIHLKIMHYPYLSETYLNNTELLNKTFTKQELELIKDYLANPEKYPEKKSFFQAVFGREKFKNLFFNNQKQYISYVTDVDFVSKWKKSKNADIDLSILRKSYQLRLRDFDKIIGYFLNFYATIEDNTAIVFTGDHGETLGKHDYLSHGAIPYDDVMRFFYSIHFPYQEQKGIIKHQFSQSTTAKIIEDVALGKITEKNFIVTLPPSNFDESVYSLSCSGDIISIRVDNKWKLIYYVSQDRFELFDLLKDPNEQHDVSNEHFAFAQSLKFKLLDNVVLKKTYNTGECIR
jgi:arylsulfatase A-like enzyme